MEAAIVTNATGRGYQWSRRRYTTPTRSRIRALVNKIAASKADTVITGNWSNDSC